jgi:antitoxin MazE
METTIKKWGNSLAVRIPGIFSRQSGITEGTEVEIKVENGSLVITPVKRKYTLKELLDQVNDSNLHSEVDTGEVKGNEIW